MALPVTGIGSLKRPHSDGCGDSPITCKKLQKHDENLTEGMKSDVHNHRREPAELANQGVADHSNISDVRMTSTDITMTHVTEIGRVSETNSYETCMKNFSEDLKVQKHVELGDCSGTRDVSGMQDLACSGIQDDCSTINVDLETKSVSHHVMVSDDVQGPDKYHSQRSGQTDTQGPSKECSGGTGIREDRLDQEVCAETEKVVKSPEAGPSKDCESGPGTSVQPLDCELPQDSSNLEPGINPIPKPLHPSESGREGRSVSPGSPDLRPVRRINPRPPHLHDLPEISGPVSAEEAREGLMTAMRYIQQHNVLPGTAFKLGKLFRRPPRP